ncbi:hypothetical protein F5B19DRAFT_110755 [Rostrohypoxylon terebratum]|nr:hypothetical protein F5B19DRAFT_110755 [Rostrohypoxylon terebratum]
MNGSPRPNMPAKATRRKACAACTRAKRPCSKRWPCCERCERKNVPCRYPPINQTAREYAVADDGSAAAEKTPDSAEEPLPIHVVTFEPLLSCFRKTDADETDHPCATGLAKDTKTLRLEHDWFYSPDSWTIAHTSTPAFPASAFDPAGLKQHVATVQSWLRRWAATGRSPFIHHRLYSQRMPRCVQDAYTTLTAYLSRTPETSDLCFRIVQDRAAGIVGEAQSGTESASSSMLSDPLDHLARVHALFVYQMIGLFDGDIAMRAAAEGHMPILTSWVAEMWQSAGFDANMYSAVLSLQGGVDGAVNSPKPISVSSTVPWQRWIVSESIRRAWLSATITQAVYQLLKEGWAECPGSINWTPRAGLWEAPDQFSWNKLVTGGRGPLFVPSLRADLLYKKASPAEVDEFGHAVLAVEFGLEHTRRWEDHIDS